MKKKMLAFLMAVLIVVGIFPVTAMADENVAKIGETEYATLQEAVNAAAASGATIKLLANLENISTVSLPAGVTLDGDGHKISGNSAIYINAAGGTVTNVKFEGIHNEESISENDRTKYDLTRTTGKLTAIYGEGLSGKATITGCTFDKIDWDAIQITPVAGAEVRITGNTFKHTKDESAIRYVHIQSEKNIDFTANVTGNKFLDCDKLAETGIEVYYPADGGKVNCSGNYMDAPMGVCIGTGTSFNNAYAKAFKFKDANLANDVEIAIIVYDPADNTYFYPTEEDAIKAGVVAKIGNMGYKTLAKAVAAAQTNETVELLKDVTVIGTGVTDGSAGGTAINIDKNNITLQGNGHTVTEGSGFDNEKKCSMFGVISENVTIENLTIRGTQYLAHGINLYKAKNAVVKNVTVENANKNAVCVNASSATIDGLTDVNCTWGGVNIDVGQNVTPVDNGTTATLRNNKLISVTVENSKGYNGSISAVIESGTYGLVRIGSVQSGSPAPTISITGGTFSSDPKAYLAKGYFSSKNAADKWVVEKMEKVVVEPAVVDGDSIKVGTGEVTVEGAGETGQPTVVQAADAITDTLYTEAFLNYEDPHINEAVTGGGTVKMSIVPKAATVVNDSGVVITGMTFEVHPENGTGETINNSNIRKPITFRLPIDKNITDKTVAVYHEETAGGEFKLVGTFEIKTENNEKYIEIEASNFSLYSYKVLNEANAVAKTDDGKCYATLANAVEKASGKTITVLKNTDEVVTVERAMSFELEVANGVKFNGAIRPGDDYVRHIYGDKYYFELYEAGDTIVIGGNRNKDAKADTAKEENPETGAPVMNMGVLAVLAVAYVATRKH